MLTGLFSSPSCSSFLGARAAVILRSRAARSDLSRFNSSSLPHCLATIASSWGTSALSLAVRSSYWTIMPGIFSSALTKFMQAAWVSDMAIKPLLNLYL